jgi:hypothetical protein
MHTFRILFHIGKMKTMGGTTFQNSSKGGLAMDFVNLLGLSDNFSPSACDGKMR